MRRLIDFVRSRMKATVVWLGMKGAIPLWPADWIIQRGGLRDA